MAQIKKKFILANAVDGSKIRMLNNTALRFRNAADSADIDVLKLDGSNRIQFPSIPQAAGTPSDPSDLATKAYVDAASGSGAAEDVTYDNATSGLTATDVQAAIDEVEGRVDTAESDITAVEGDVANLVTLSGVAVDSTHLGTFTGTTIPDSQTVKQALQALETSVETKAASSVVSEIDQNVDDLISLSGVAENSANLGTFTGSTIADDQTIKQALQALETSVETKAASSVVSEIDQNVDDLITLSGVAENATHLGTFSGSIIPDSSSVKAALQSLETSIGALPDPMEYKGNWAASTNTPELEDGVGNNGDVYYVTDAGTVDFGSGNIVFAQGDRVVYSGTDSVWQKWDTTDQVTSVNGATGAVTVNAINELTGDVTTSAASGSESKAATIANGAVTLAKMASNSVDENKIVSTAISATGALDGGSGTKLSVKVDAATIKKNGSNLLEGLKHREEKITLNGTDITNQYVDLAKAIHGVDAANNSASLFVVGGLMQEKAVDYTVSLTGGSGGVTRIAFAGDLGTGGPAALESGDILVIGYDYLT